MLFRSSPINYGQNHGIYPTNVGETLIYPGGESLNLYSDWTAHTPAKQCKNSTKQSKISFFRPFQLQCPDCEVVFATDSLAHTPNMTKDTPVETDLHHVLPHPALRAALIAMCPACPHTSWYSSFVEDPLVPYLAVAPAEVAFSKKFPHAVLHLVAKLEPITSDRALFALNGSGAPAKPANHQRSGSRLGRSGTGSRSQ